MKKISHIALALMLAVSTGGAAFAQAMAPADASAAKPAPAAAAKPAATTMSAADKAALSKKCSTDADAKGLKGKERKKFRNDCKRGKV